MAVRPIDSEMAKQIAREHLIDPYHVISACSEIDKTPTLTPLNELLTCDGCYWETHGSFGKCIDCIRGKTDNYRRPPEGEEDT